MFDSELNTLNVPKKLLSKYAPQTYDAVWTIALALKSAEDSWRSTNNKLRVNNFDYSRQDMANEFIKQLSKINFLGVSVNKTKNNYLILYINNII